MIRSQFLSCVPIKEISWDLFQTAPEAQTHLFHEIFRHKVAMTYPPVQSYQLSFLKQWMKIVEEDNLEVIEEVYHLYTKLIGSYCPETGYCYKSYDLGEEIGYITLRESRHFISQGTTGLCTWQAAQHLSEWIAEHKELFHQKHILELGSGTGLLGLATIGLTHPASYTFTDCNTEVLALLNTNIAMNKSNVDVRVIQLDWTLCVGVEFPVDCVLAADVVYDKQLIDSLVQQLESLFSSQRNLVAYIASTVRNEDTYRYFIEKLDHSALSYQQQTLASTKLFHCDRNLRVSILKLSCNKTIIS